MKPSLEEVLRTITELWKNKKARRTGVSIEELTDTMDEHVGNVMPSLLILAREKYISMKSVRSGLVLIVRKKQQAA